MSFFCSNPDMTRVLRAKSQVLVMARKALHYVAFRALQSNLLSVSPLTALQPLQTPCCSFGKPGTLLFYAFYLPQLTPLAGMLCLQRVTGIHFRTFFAFAPISHLQWGICWPHPSPNPHPHPFALHFIFPIARITFYNMICLCIMFLVYSLSTHVRIVAPRGQKSSCVLLTSVFQIPTTVSHTAGTNKYCWMNEWIIIPIHLTFHQTDKFHANNLL